MTVPAAAASSIPPPKATPWIRAVTHAHRAGGGDGRVTAPGRVTWAVAGSGNDPNSSRSPPEQNEGPSPRSTTVVVDGSSSATARAATRSSRSRRSIALCRWARSSTTWTLVVEPFHAHGGVVARRVTGIDAPTPGGGVARPPLGELGSRLEHRVRRRLGRQGGVERDARQGAQQDGQRGSGEWVGGDLGFEGVELTRCHDDVGGDRSGCAELGTERAHDERQRAGEQHRRWKRRRRRPRAGAPRRRRELVDERRGDRRVVLLDPEAAGDVHVAHGRSAGQRVPGASRATRPCAPDATVPGTRRTVPRRRPSAPSALHGHHRVIMMG